MEPIQQAQQQSMPENAVTPPVQSQVTPDLVSPEGKQALHATLSNTIVQKKFLDFILQSIATKVGGEFTSRVKNPETVIQKIATKRMAGEDYNLNDVNDAYGGRIVVKDKSDIPEVQKMLTKAKDLGVFDIGKEQMVKNGVHQAYHMDITSSGIKGEIQIMTPKDELKSVSEHSLYATMGDKLPPGAKDLVDTQGKVIDKMPKSIAHQKAMKIQQVGQANNGKPIDPRIIASILKQ